MSIIDLFSKRKTQSAGDASGHIEVMSALNDVTNGLAGINERLRKMESWQKETTLQLDEFSDAIQNGGTDENTILEALVVFGDQIDNLYRFASSDTGSLLFEQAQMTWAVAKATGVSTRFGSSTTQARP